MSLACRGGDGSRERMFARALEARGKRQQGSLIELLSGHHGSHSRFAFSQGPCGPQEFESRGSKTVFVMESAENGFSFHGIGLSATVS